MKSEVMYSQKIKHYHHIFDNTADAYRAAVDFFIDVCLREWNRLSRINSSKWKMNFLEGITHPTGKRPFVPYCFDTAEHRFYKFPSYLRRSACMEAIGKVSSYMSALATWEEDSSRKRPGLPKAGYVYPCLYRDNMYKAGDTSYTAQIKAYIRNTWDWISVSLRRTDVDYVKRLCSSMKQSAPTLQKRGKEWFLDFLYTETVFLTTAPVWDQKAVAVDLGINSACTCSCILPDGTVAGRKILHLPAEEDCLGKAVGRIKKAQQQGAGRAPRLWGMAKGMAFLPVITEQVGVNEVYGIRLLENAASGRVLEKSGFQTFFTGEGAYHGGVYEISKSIWKA